MITGCYSLDLYCDNFDMIAFSQRLAGQTEDVFGHKYDDFPAQFAGHTQAECVRHARKLGWVVNLKGWKAYCPRCVVAQRKRKRKVTA